MHALPPVSNAGPGQRIQRMESGVHRLQPETDFQAHKCRANARMASTHLHYHIIRPIARNLRPKAPQKREFVIQTATMIEPILLNPKPADFLNNHANTSLKSPTGC